MKHLKRFNEELKYDTYVSASSKLMDKGHTRRSLDIKKHADEKSHHLYPYGFELPMGSYGSYEKFYVIDINVEKPGNDVSIVVKLKSESGKVEFVEFNIEDGAFKSLELKGEPLFFNNRRDAVEFKRLLSTKYPEYKPVYAGLSLNDIYKH